MHFDPDVGQIGKLLIARGADINAKDRANQTPLHRAATTGSTGFINLLLKPPEGSPKTRLNTADRVGDTPLHLAMESAHAEAACLLIEAGADRERVRLFATSRMECAKDRTDTSQTDEHRRGDA
ncbi:hypothetical protein GY45DRAFT_1327123 [Cubamyces sp. BRFM 1775]|nr:hypothetical protein GY45DRAFT_1327123 [Cubamyces sp. BRFM 1775]